ncbi:hypothetical protein GCM10007420_20270 [Glycocaulis albus]|uniref:Uncharacterized protein n=1 Tax=Glycocaulis albus TaxID=1382801 RepID=A0ABQ1XV39_9PROT|nr:hypothetical protein [Glycocaulis albus]MBV5259011.1 hypothetical protein [Synechococcus moorigangaii CMS01]GGH03846.1 hypothetical protein GCM10007420_20270 [Glycocaulis albus]
MSSTPKAPRPVFFEDAANDRLTAIITALAAEVAVLSERVHSLEAVLAEKAVLETGALDAFQPSAEQLAARRERHEAFNQRVFYVLEEELASLPPE